MNKNDRRETESDTTDPVANSRAQRQYPNSTGRISLDPDIFIADVINMVNDLTIDGFDSMEEFLERKLDLKSEESQRALNQCVDSIYGKVQMNIDESFKRWESTCRDSFFNKLPSISVTMRSSEKTTGDATSILEDGQEEALDAELRSLQSQLVAAHREGGKMRRQLPLLEKQLASRREVVSDAKSLEESFDGDVLAEVMRSADLLKDTIQKANRSLEKKSCLQTRPEVLGDCLAEQSPAEMISLLKLPYDMDIGDPLVVHLLG